MPYLVDRIAYASTTARRERLSSSDDSLDLCRHQQAGRRPPDHLKVMPEVTDLRSGY